MLFLGVAEIISSTNELLSKGGNKISDLSDCLEINLGSGGELNESEDDGLVNNEVVIFTLRSYSLVTRELSFLVTVS